MDISVLNMKLVFDHSIPLIDELLTKHPFKCDSVSNLCNEKLRDADILICRSTTKVDKVLLKDSAVKIVATCTSGTDHIDKDYLKNTGIQLIDARGCNAQSVCDYVFASLAQLYSCLKGKTIGIIGVGHVGTKVSCYARAIGMQVKHHDPLRAIIETEFKQTPLDEISNCDIISLHTPLTVDGPYPTIGMIDGHFLSKLKPHTALINTSRGEVIDEPALLALNTPIKLILDVFHSEPMISESILKKATIVTPHIAGHAIQAKQRASLMVYRKICQAINIEPEHSTYDELLLQKTSKVTLNDIRGLYNPIFESIQFKETGINAFKGLRKSHYRHEFSCH